MRLATLRTPGGPVAVVVEGREAAVITDGRGVTAYADVGDLLRAGQDGMELAAAASASSTFAPLDEADLLRPILAPEAVVCVGLNYRTHVLEMGRKLPEHPTLFSKLARSLTDPYADVELPAVSDRVDYEGELAVVVGSGGRTLSPDQAWEAVAGFCVFNDVTIRDYQKRTLQWFAGKTWEASTPFGPTIVTRDQVEDVGALELTVTVNGQQRQHARIDDLIFDVPALISDLSTIVTLRPGDLIATGTPGGVGDAMDPKGYLADGDVVQVSITGLGTLTNRFHRAHRSG